MNSVQYQGITVIGSFKRLQGVPYDAPQNTLQIRPWTRPCEMIFLVQNFYFFCFCFLYTIATTLYIYIHIRHVRPTLYMYIYKWGNERTGKEKTESIQRDPFVNIAAAATQCVEPVISPGGTKRSLPLFMLVVIKTLHPRAAIPHGNE